MTAPSPLMASSLAFLFERPDASIDDFWRMTSEEIDDFPKFPRQHLVVADLLNDGYAVIRLTATGRAIAAAEPTPTELRPSSTRALVYMSKHPKASIAEIRTAADVLGNKRAMEALVFAEMLSDQYVEMRLTSKGRRAGRRAARRRR